MWKRECELDAEPLPIPSRIASNEEFIPPQQTPQQKEYEARLHVLADEAAKGQGMARRDFLRTGSGLAAAMLALNQVFGNCYDVAADEVRNQDAFRERWPKDQFIFDVQTHHVDVGRKWYDDTPEGRRVTGFIRMVRPLAGGLQASLEALNRAHY